MKNQPFDKRLAFAIAGIRNVFQEEASFRWQVFAACSAYLLLGLMQADPIWWAFFSLGIALVLGAELFNSALESMMDHLHPKTHPKIGLAKDCAAGAVLVFSLASIALLVCFLLNYFYERK